MPKNDSRIFTSIHFYLFEEVCVDKKSNAAIVIEISEINSIQEKIKEAYLRAAINKYEKIFIYCLSLQLCDKICEYLQSKEIVLRKDFYASNIISLKNFAAKSAHRNALTLFPKSGTAVASAVVSCRKDPVAQ